MVLVRKVQLGIENFLGQIPFVFIYPGFLQADFSGVIANRFDTAIAL
jgi:hypothetical protein